MLRAYISEGTVSIPLAFQIRLPWGRMIKKISQSMNRLLIIGAGGHGRSVAEAVVLSGEYEVVGFLDDGATESTISDIPVLGRVANPS